MGRILGVPPFTPQPQVTISAPFPAPQSSSLCLWGISLLFCVAESVFAVRSAQLAHQVLELRPWLGKSSHRMVRHAIQRPPPTALKTPPSPLGAPAGGLRLICPHRSVKGPHLENWGNSLLPQDKRENTEAQRTQLSQVSHTADIWLS